MLLISNLMDEPRMNLIDKLAQWYEAQPIVKGLGQLHPSRRSRSQRDAGIPCVSE